jgi:hypothetical protein
MTLDEEGAADKKLTELAKSINLEANEEIASNGTSHRGTRTQKRRAARR